MALRYSIPQELQKTVIVSALICVVILFLGLRQIHEHTVKKISEYRHQRKRAAVENNVGKQLEELKKIREELPSLKDTGIFLGDVTKIAGQLNLRMLTVKGEPVERRPDYVKLQVNMELETSFHEIGNFISKLETVKRFINIENISIRPIGKVEKTSTDTGVKIKISTIYLTDTSLEI